MAEKKKSSGAPQKNGSPDSKQNKKADAGKNVKAAADTAKKAAAETQKKAEGTVKKADTAAKKTETAVKKADTAVKKAAETAAPEKPKKRFRDRFNKKNELSILLLSLALSFTVFFFSPVDIFLGNQRDFVVTFKYIAIPMLLTALLSTLLLEILFHLFLVIADWLYQVMARLFFGFLLAIYTQSLLLNSKMASVTGDDAKYTDNMKSVTINLIILSVILLLPLTFYIIAKILPKNKFFNLGKGIVLPYVCGIIIFMQLAGTASSIAKADFKKYNRSYTQYLSYEPSLSLSRENNVVVFLTDRLDGYWMDEVIERYPDVSTNLTGFTYYQNNISHNTNTFPSVPQMLTNCLYRGTEWPDYCNKAWDGKTAPRVLSENGYDVNLLIDNLTTYTSIAQLDGQCSNVLTYDKDEITMNYTGNKGIIPTMTQLSLAKHAPYALKSSITRGLGSSLSVKFLTYEHDNSDMQPMAVDVASDVKYYKYIVNKRLRADNDNKTFTFVHLNCSHGSDETEAALYDPNAEVDIYSTTRGGFQIIFEYIEQMKRLGIYDNSTIIILGDHGRAPVEIECDGEPGLTSEIITGLLIKPAHASQLPLKIDRDTELSNDFFPASVVEYAGIDHSDFGISYQDVINNGLHPERFMQTFNWGGYGKVYYKALYKVTGDARDFSNWEVQPGHE